MPELDPCLEALEKHASTDPDLAVQFLLKFTGLTKKTPRERIGPAIAEEIAFLCQQARSGLDELTGEVKGHELHREALAILSRGADAESGRADARAYFPRTELEAVTERARPFPCLSTLVDLLSTSTAKHRAFERRVGWLLSGTTVAELASLDPKRDCDQIFHAMSSTFRVEGRVLELLTVNRIAQSTSSSLFIRSTREAVDNGVARFYDTFALFANFFEWGEHSKRGRATIARMNGIHGRYYIPNAGMKYILLEAAFTWLDGADRIAHRPLLEVERRGYFHAFAKMGRAMNIAELSDDYDEMYAWYESENQKNAGHDPLKTDTFETIVQSSFGSAFPPELQQAMFAAARVAMDDTYRSALGYAPPTASEIASVRAVFFTLGHALAALPRTPHLRSLQNNPARPKSAAPEELGAAARSSAMPMIDAARPNGGFPEGLHPVQEGAVAVTPNLPDLSWNEINRHCTLENLWVVVDGFVYDVTGWARLHPGGAEALLAVAGQDGSRAFHAAAHSAATQVFKQNYRIGRVAR